MGYTHTLTHKLIHTCEWTIYHQLISNNLLPVRSSLDMTSLFVAALTSLTFRKPNTFHLLLQTLFILKCKKHLYSLHVSLVCLRIVNSRFGLYHHHLHLFIVSNQTIWLRFSADCCKQLNLPITAQPLHCVYVEAT